MGEETGTKRVGLQQILILTSIYIGTLSVTFLICLMTVSSYDFELIVISILIGGPFALYLGVLLQYGFRLSLGRSRGFRSKYEPFLPLVTIIFNTAALGIAMEMNSGEFWFTSLIFIGAATLYIFFRIVVLMHKALSYRMSFARPEAAKAAPVSVVEQADDNHPTELLGRGASVLDRVIKSILFRSGSAERVSQFSMVIMIVLVLIGGISAVGLSIADYVDRLRDIEKERVRVSSLSRGLNEALNESRKIAALKDFTYDAKLSGGTKLSEINKQLNGSSLEKIVYNMAKNIDRVDKQIDEVYRKPGEHIATVLDDIKGDAQTNWTDVAIRVTIAVLTLFLVQIFYGVYKYNRQLSSSLSAKAEVLEFIGQDEDGKQKLSDTLVESMKETLPSFGPNPKTPVSEAVDLAEKLLGIYKKTP